MSTPARSATIAKLLAVVIFALVLLQLYLSTKVATTPRGSALREALQQQHFSLGLTALLLVTIRSWFASAAPQESRPDRLPADADALARLCCKGLYLVIVLMALIGPLQAWAEGQRIVYFGLFSLPSLIAAKYQSSVTFGYLHSALGFLILFLMAFAAMVAVYQAVRYKTSWFRMLPASSWES